MKRKAKVHKAYERSGQLHFSNRCNNKFDGECFKYWEYVTCQRCLKLRRKKK